MKIPRRGEACRKTKRKLSSGQSFETKLTNLDEFEGDEMNLTFTLLKQLRPLDRVKFRTELCDLNFN